MMPTTPRAPSPLDKALQPAERVIPLLRNQPKISIDFGETLLFQLPDALAPVPRAAHETGVFHHAQMFGDRLTRDGKPGGEPRDRHRPVGAEAGDEAKTRLVAQGGKHRRRTFELRRRPGATRPGQDVSRSAS